MCVQNVIKSSCMLKKYKKIQKLKKYNFKVNIFIKNQINFSTWFWRKLGFSRKRLSRSAFVKDLSFSAEHQIMTFTEVKTYFLEVFRFKRKIMLLYKSKLYFLSFLKPFISQKIKGHQNIHLKSSTGVTSYEKVDMNFNANYTLK